MSKTKQILLLRHAKSSWADPLTKDITRPLNERGRHAAQVMGRLLLDKDLSPQLILCSSAVRTRETYDGLGKAVDGIPVEYADAIYEASVDRLLKVLQAVDERRDSVMLIGHNPGMEGLTKLLCGGMGDAASMDLLEEKFPTGALAVLSGDAGAWTALGPATCRLEAFYRPADQD